jgi:hypothetical protein
MQTTDKQKQFARDQEEKIQSAQREIDEASVLLIWNKLIALMAGGVLTWGRAAVDCDLWRGRSVDLTTPEGAATAVGVIAEILHPENLRRGARASRAVRDAREAIERDREASPGPL